MAIRATRTNNKLNNSIRPVNKSSLDLMIRLYKEADEAKWETNFVRGQLLDSMLKLGAGQKYLSAQLGISISHLRNLTAVYKAFPEDEDRNQRLSWSHHHIALQTPNPVETLQMADENELSIEQLKSKLRREKPTRVTKRMRDAMETHFNLLIHSMVERGWQDDLPNWDDTLSVFVWWQKEVKEMSHAELFYSVAIFCADEKDNQITKEMVRVLKEEYSVRRGNSKFIRSVDYSFIFGRE